MGVRLIDFRVPVKVSKSVAFFAQKNKMSETSRIYPLRGQGGKTYEVCDYRGGCGGYECCQPGKKETT